MTQKLAQCLLAFGSFAWIAAPQEVDNRPEVTTRETAPTFQVGSNLVLAPLVAEIP